MHRMAAFTLISSRVSFMDCNGRIPFQRQETQYSHLEQWVGENWGRNKTQSKLLGSRG